MILEILNQTTDPVSRSDFGRLSSLSGKTAAEWPPLKENGKMHADSRDKTNILNRQYESVYTHEDTSSVPKPSGEPYNPMEEITVTEEGVRKLLQKLNPHKASGPDLIPARILKDMADEISPLLTIIFQRSFDCGKVPDD